MDYWGELTRAIANAQRQQDANPLAGAGFAAPPFAQLGIGMNRYGLPAGELTAPLGGGEMSVRGSADPMRRNPMWNIGVGYSRQF